MRYYTWDIRDYTFVRNIFIYNDHLYLAGTIMDVHEPGEQENEDIVLTKLTLDAEHVKTWKWDHSTYEYTGAIFVDNGSVYLGGRYGMGAFLLRFDE